MMRRILRRAMLLLSVAVISVFSLGPGIVSAQMPVEQKQLFNDQIFNFNIEDDPEQCGNPTGAGATDGSQVDRFLQVLAHQESNGNPKAHASGSSAAGKYQYITDTWKSSTRLNYPPASQYATADLAPEAMQDAVAKIEYTKKFKSLGDDIFKLAISHFYPKALTDPSKLDSLIGTNKITPRQYANSIINKMGSGVGTNIQLLYAQAPDFGTFFAQANGALPQQSDVLVSSVASGCGGTITGDCGTKGLQVPSGGSGVNVCYFNQGDLGRDGGYNWPGCGCLPTSLLMIQATFEKRPDFPQNEVLNGLKAAGGVDSDGCRGVIGGALNYLENKINYKVTRIAARGTTITDGTLAKVKEMLAQGNIILTHTHNFVDSANTNGTSGHFLLIHAVDSSGNFYVANPGARADNGKAVSPARVKAWLDEFYAVRK